MITNFGPCNTLGLLGGIGPSELLLIFAVLVLLFGAEKLPQLARSMGTSMGEFKKAQKESEESLKKYESSLKNSVTSNSEQAVEATEDIQKKASNLGISIEGKTNDQILDEINNAKLKS